MKVGLPQIDKQKSFLFKPNSKAQDKENRLSIIETINKDPSNHVVMSKTTKKTNKISSKTTTKKPLTILKGN